MPVTYASTGLLLAKVRLGAVWENASCRWLRRQVVCTGGIGVEDLPAIYREEYLYAVEHSRRQHDPAADWDGFVKVLWRALVPAFGLDVEVLEPDEHHARLTGLREADRAS